MTVLLGLIECVEAKTKEKRVLINDRSMDGWESISVAELTLTFQSEIYTALCKLRSRKRHNVCDRKARSGNVAEN